MTTALHHWINEPVRVTLAAPTPAVVEGTLFQIDDAGIVLENPNGKVYIPLGAILHVKLCDASGAVAGDRGGSTKVSAPVHNIIDGA